jgi:hypothetical protein
MTDLCLRVASRPVAWVRASLGAVLAWAALFVGPAQAHPGSDAQLRLQVHGQVVEQRLDIALRDLDRDLVLDADADTRVTWGEVRSRWADIEALAADEVSLRFDGADCRPLTRATAGSDAAPLQRLRHGTYASLATRWQCDRPPSGVTIGYRLFAATDATHRGLLFVSTEAGDRPVQALRPGSQPLRVSWAVAAAAPTGSAADTGADPSTFVGFVREGVHHILIGIDHILFLLVLLLPVVRDAAAGPAVGRARRAVIDTVQVVTAFTVAHSITLALATLGLVNPPERWVESLIAATVVAAALANLVPAWGERLRRARWSLTFAFGLVHGFGFAGALQELGVGGSSILLPLLGFNLGVELGQLAIVAVCLPLAWALRDTRLYAGPVLRGGSVAIALLALVWLVERALDLSLLPV